MKYSLFVSMVLASVVVSSAQIAGRFYYTKSWLLTKKDSAVYFRVAVFDTTKYLFVGEVDDFSMDGKPIMKGRYAAGKKNGKFESFYSNGQVESSGNFVENERKGVWKYGYHNGTPRSEIEFTNNSDYKILFFNDSTGVRRMENGTGSWLEEYKEFNLEQTVINEGTYKNYQKEGEWICRLKNGGSIYMEKYKNGKFLRGISTDSGGKKTGDLLVPSTNHLLIPYKFLVTEKLNYVAGVNRQDYPFLKRKLPMSPAQADMVAGKVEEDVVYTVVEESARPLAGMPAFYNAIADEIKYPIEARTNKIQGRVFLEFIVNKDGTLSDFEVVQGIGHGCDEEAVRAMKQASTKVKWIPGIQRGKPVRQRYALPITFRLG